MSHVAFRKASLAATFSLLAAGCPRRWLAADVGVAQAAVAAPNTLTSAEKAAGWTLLFDGKTTNGWRGYHMQSMPPAWKVVDGVLTKSGPTEDIVTTKTFGDFELMVDWMLGPAGNSGIFYRGTEKYDRVYWSTPEYQLLDDSLAAGRPEPAHFSGRRVWLLPGAQGGREVRQQLEHGAHRREGRARRALDEWREARRVRVLVARLHREVQGEQVQGFHGIRPGHLRSHRDPGRSQRRPLAAQHPRSARPAKSPPSR